VFADDLAHPNRSFFTAYPEWPQEWRADVEVAVQRTSHTAERWHDRLGSVWVALD
jgi:hypothetical protein